MHHSYGRNQGTLDTCLPESMAPSSAMMAKMQLSPLALSATAVATLTMLGSHPILSEAESGCMCMCVAQPCVDRDHNVIWTCAAGHMWLTTLSRTEMSQRASSPLCLADVWSAMLALRLSAPAEPRPLGHVFWYEIFAGHVLPDSYCHAWPC